MSQTPFRDGRAVVDQVVVVVVVVVLTLTRKIKSVVTGHAPVTLELRNTTGKNKHNPRWYTHISQLTQFMPPPETYKSEIGSQYTMCQVQAGAYVSLFTPGETKYSDCHPIPHPGQIHSCSLSFICVAQAMKPCADELRPIAQTGKTCAVRLSHMLHQSATLEKR